MSAVRIIEVNGRSTRVRLDGDPSAPPAVLLHGIGRSLEDWAPVIPKLAAHHRVISLDMPGFGFSARRPERATLASFAAGVLETLDHIGETRPVHVMGNSLGGAVALQLQAIEPQRVATLVLVNAAGFGREVTPMLRLVAVPLLGRAMTARTTPKGALLAERMSFADPALATPERVEHALAIARQPGAGIVMHEVARALGTFFGLREEWRQTLLTTIERNPRPTLVVWGDKDRVLPVKHLDAARRQLPHAATHVFAGVGHMPQIERPDEFAALVHDFIRRNADPLVSDSAHTI